MSTNKFRYWLVACAALCASACGSSPSGSPTDAGTVADAGVPDGGTASDGGTADAGSFPDGGEPVDGGEPADGGTSGGDGGFPPIPAGPYPENGWTLAGAPNGRLLGFDLSQTNEDDLLHSGGEAALYALGASRDDYHPERRPVVLVHGIQGAPSDLQAVVDRLWSLPLQLYVLAYNDYQRRTSFNGDDLAAELRSLSTLLGSGRDLAVVAHSMGGIVTRWALNRLAAGSEGGLGAYRSVEVVAVDTPWHGYAGPEDGWMMDIARPFMPDGLEDMRALSGEFQGIPGDSDPVRREGLYGVILPEKVRLTLVFAEQGDQVFDYTESVIASLPEELVSHYREATDVTGDPQLVNFWKALRDSDRVAELDTEMNALAAAGTLDTAAALGVLEHLFPRFPGDHVTVLHEHAGERTVLDLLSDRFGR